MLDKKICLGENDPDNFSLYNSKSIEELKKITPKWAYGKDVDKLYSFYLQPSSDNDVTIFLVDIHKLVINCNFAEVDPYNMFTASGQNDSRISKLLFRWDHGCFVDPPEIGIRLNEDKLTFSNGRHRTKLAYLLGSKLIPVAICEDQIDDVRKILELAEVKS